jgi:hypothetical protein
MKRPITWGVTVPFFMLTCYLWGIRILPIKYNMYLAQYGHGFSVSMLLKNFLFFWGGGGIILPKKKLIPPVSSSKYQSIQVSTNSRQIEMKNAVCTPWRSPLNPRWIMIGFWIQSWFSLSHQKVCTWEFM